MATTYYIFQKNKIVFKISDTIPLPFTKTEKDTLCAGITPLTAGKLKDDKEITVVELPEDVVLPDGYELRPLRSLLGFVDDRKFNSWGKAAQLLHCYATNRFCGSCGAQTMEHPEEQARLCPQCRTVMYPAISPCIIVLVHRRDMLLLARSPRFPKSMYSTLAGFVEPGESAEECLHREIYEEVRLKVANVRYFKSQPWPFPGQLMLGFFAEYRSGDITIDGVEISEAQWYKYNDLPEIPGRETIAGQLIRHHIRSISPDFKPDPI